VVYDEQKRTADAQNAFQRSVQLDSTSKLSATAFAQLGFYRLLGKDWSGAVGLLERAVTVDPQHVQGWVWLGQAYQNSGNRAKATEAYNRALQLNPSQPDALKGLKMLKGNPPAEPVGQPAAPMEAVNEAASGREHRHPHAPRVPDRRRRDR
jgi:cytochrome c-type biogenesis protein CcmH/NrfG